MKKILFAVICLSVSSCLFANSADNTQITKKYLQENFSKELKVLKTELAKAQKVAVPQQKPLSQQPVQYQTIVKSVEKALQAAIDNDDRYISQYKNSPDKQEYLEYFKSSKIMYQKMLEQKVGVKMAEYAKKNLNLSQITDIRAYCVNPDQITIAFSYAGRKAKIIYQSENGHILHVVAQDILNEDR